MLLMMSLLGTFCYQKGKFCSLCWLFFFNLSPFYVT